MILVIMLINIILQNRKFTLGKITLNTHIFQVNKKYSIFFQEVTVHVKSREFKLQKLFVNCL